MAALRRQYSGGGYSHNERLAPLISQLSSELERRTEPLLGDAPASVGSPLFSASSGSYSSGASEAAGRRPAPRAASSAHRLAA